MGFWWQVILCWHMSMIVNERFRAVLKGIFHNDRTWGEFDFFKITLLYYPLLSKSLLSDLVHGFDNSSSKLETKCSSRLVKLQFFQFFVYVDGWGKKQNFQKFSYQPLQTILQGFFLYIYVIRAQHTFEIRILSIFRSFFPSFHFSWHWFFYYVFFSFRFIFHDIFVYFFMLIFSFLVTLKFFCIFFPCWSFVYSFFFIYSYKDYSAEW